MKYDKPLIFITNDDGYEAKGINSLIESLKGIGELIVVAPDGPRSGMSSAITSISPLRIRSIIEETDLKVFTCTGTPADCVKLGISQFTKRRPDLVVSGINHGSNSAVSVLYSGTMGAAIEGSLFKIPSVGLSLLDHSADADFLESKMISRLIVKQVLKEGLPIGTCLNVNIPKGNNKGIRICRQTQGQWVEEFVKSKDGGKRDVYWLSGRFNNEEPNDINTDEWALKNGYVSVVPVKVDLTHHEHMAAIKSWENLL